jgi:hypothetical protein
MAYHRIDPAIREEVLFKVKQGVSVLDLSAQYGLSRKTIYGWLSGTSLNSPSSLTLGKLKRERDELLKLVGELTLLLKKGEKSKST